MTAPIDDRVAFARDLAEFLVALRGVDATDGPPPGPHCAYRGAPVAQWHDEVQALLPRIDDRSQRVRAASCWRDALAARREFVRRYDADDATWARGRGWALWKVLILLGSPERRWVQLAHRTLDALLEEPPRAS